VQSLSYPHALADSNQHMRIREQTLEFSSTVLSALSPYLKMLYQKKKNENQAVCN